MRQGGVEEASQAVIRGYSDKHVTGFPGIWPPTYLDLSFKYLVRVLTALDYDWPVVVGNIRKVQTKWDMLSRILVQEGGKHTGVRKLFQCGGSGGTSIQVGDVDYDPPYRSEP